MLFSYCIQLCTYFHWCKKIVFTGLLKMRRSCACCAKTRKLQKGKEEEKGNGLCVVCVHWKSGKVFPPFSCTDLVTVCQLQLHHLVLIFQERKLTSFYAVVAQLLLDLTKILSISFIRFSDICKNKLVSSSESTIWESLVKIYPKCFV